MNTFTDYAADITENWQCPIRNVLLLGISCRLSSFCLAGMNGNPAFDGSLSQSSLKGSIWDLLLGRFLATSSTEVSDSSITILVRGPKLLMQRHNAPGGPPIGTPVSSSHYHCITIVAHDCQCIAVARMPQIWYITITSAAMAFGTSTITMLYNHDQRCFAPSPELWRLVALWCWVVWHCLTR
jgi:hypothetical protein